jgi:hypothetical protein
MTWRSGAVAAAALVAALPVAFADGTPKRVPGAAVRKATEQRFDRRNFSHPTKIDNPFLPMVPGTQFIYEGSARTGKGRLKRRVVVTVTDLTKKIDGLDSRVIWDRDFNNGRKIEQELAFFSQDDAKNIWNTGEYVEELETGTLDAEASTWIAGRAGARPGIHFLGDPRPEAGRYSQGYGPAVEWGDIAYVVRTDAHTCVPVGCFDDVVLTDETNPLEHDDGHQHKYYARGVGNLRAAPAHRDRQAEILVLKKVRRLTGAALAAARNEALTLDRRGYRAAKHVYGALPRARRG